MSLKVIAIAMSQNNKHRAQFVVCDCAIHYKGHPVIDFTDRIMAEVETIVKHASADADLIAVKRLAVENVCKARGVPQEVIVRAFDELQEAGAEEAGYYDELYCGYAHDRI